MYIAKQGYNIQEYLFLIISENVLRIKNYYLDNILYVLSRFTMYKIDSTELCN